MKYETFDVANNLKQSAKMQRKMLKGDCGGFSLNPKQLKP
jgi:hypothetical protein